ncbi:heme exporter protein CcmB [Marinoscillum sp. 108]|uniref:heme exporter protein CcmB n=1 Tax=Marinoscillum sp. 108 TaxID=2653151 RepID=UPI0012F2D5DE|nr:heme exporter protein CcmB [Marinoscillum sp. 108]VXD19064.1 Heme exporter protein B [Marinoscillum sp. 108]
MLKQLRWLIYKDLQIDWRSKYPLAGILLYITSLIITSYLSFTGFIEPKTWNALFWLILLFISINAVAKSFSQEEDRTLYYFHLIRPERIILAKLIYYSLYQWLLIGGALLVYTIFLGFPVKEMTPFLVNLLVGSFGLSSAFTMVSSIASKTNNNAVMMAILGFPVIIPILILAISNSKTIVLGGSWSDINDNLITLLSVNVIIIALSYILFPFTWKS